MPLPKANNTIIWWILSVIHITHYTLKLFYYCDGSDITNKNRYSKYRFGILFVRIYRKNWTGKTYTLYINRKHKTHFRTWNCRKYNISCSCSCSCSLSLISPLSLTHSLTLSKISQVNFSNESNRNKINGHCLSVHVCVRLHVVICLAVGLTLDYQNLV